MDNNIVVNQVIILFLIMVVGFIARKRRIIDGMVNKKLSELLLNITAPFLVVSSFHFKFSRDMLFNAGIVFLFSIGAHAVSILLGKLLYFKFPNRIKSVLKFVTVFSNCGFMGFPVLESLFGKVGIFYGSIYVMAFNIFIWTYGVMLFTGEKNIKSVRKAFTNPGIIAVFIGMVIFLFSIQLPGPVFKALDMVGGMTVPLSMLIVGALLADTDFKSLFSGFGVYYSTAVRLILLPLLTLLVLKLFGMTGDLLGICVLLVAMPAAANTAIFAEKFDADALFASQCVAVSTVLSIITIPAVILLIG